MKLVRETDIHTDRQTNIKKDRHIQTDWQTEREDFKIKKITCNEASQLI